MPENILDMVKKVALYRSLGAKLAAEKKEQLARWEAENAELLEILAQYTSELAEAEPALRAEAIKIYQETGSKTPGPGVGIRLMQVLSYEEAEAFRWAVEHVMALRLDVKAFEKITKASPLPFVTITQEPQATISGDLEAVLIALDVLGEIKEEA